MGKNFRGWIRHEIYDAYGYGFDPIIIKTEKY
jgi:inosine/xanthosine triphosphate pyrophosphatase family protein